MTHILCVSPLMMGPAEPDSVCEIAGFQGLSGAVLSAEALGGINRALFALES